MGVSKESTVSDKVPVVLVISGAYESCEAAQRIVKLQRTICCQIIPVKTVLYGKTA